MEYPILQSLMNNSKKTRIIIKNYLDRINDNRHENFKLELELELKNELKKIYNYALYEGQRFAYDIVTQFSDNNIKPISDPHLKTFEEYYNTLK